MNTEELKMILEALGRVSDTAGAGVQWWLVLHYGEKMLSTLAWAGVFGVGIWKAVEGFKAVVEEMNQ